MVHEKEAAPKKRRTTKKTEVKLEVKPDATIVVDGETYSGEIENTNVRKFRGFNRNRT